MNKYEMTYTLVRKRIADDTYYDADKKAWWLSILDACYFERKPFPFEIAFIFGDPLAPSNGFDGLAKRIRGRM